MAPRSSTGRRRLPDWLWRFFPPQNFLLKKTLFRSPRNQDPTSSLLVGQEMTRKCHHVCPHPFSSDGKWRDEESGYDIISAIYKGSSHPDEEWRGRVYGGGTFEYYFLDKSGNNPRHQTGMRLRLGRLGSGCIKNSFMRLNRGEVYLPAEMT